MQALRMVVPVSTDAATAKAMRKRGPADVLIIGGTLPQGNRLARILGASGTFRVTEATSAFKGIAEAKDGDCRFDIIILELPLPDSQAPELCATIRQRGVLTPIIVVSETANEGEVIGALDSGAIDYLVRPISAGELSARLRAHIREYEASDNAVLFIGPYNFRPAARSLLKRSTNQRLRLTQKEADILRSLYRAAGEPVSRQKLLHEVWGYHKRTRTHTVETHIYRLRRKIEPDPSVPSLIVNDGSGYCLGPA